MERGNQAYVPENSKTARMKLLLGFYLDIVLSFQLAHVFAQGTLLTAVVCLTSILFVAPVPAGRT